MRSNPTDTPEIQPALTPSEWDHLLPAPAFAGEFNGISAYPSEGGTEIWLDERPHALAALCLYQQPFGFDAADIEALRLLVVMFRQEVARHEISPDPDAAERAIMERVLRTAAKLDALLPPDSPARSPQEGPP